MPRIALERSAKWVERQRAAGLHPVGGVPGLALQVEPPNGKSWILRAVMPDGRRRDMGLGPFPEVSLKEAREAAKRARRAIRSGIDPIDAGKRDRKNRQVGKETVTFKSAAKTYIALQTPAWRGPKSAEVWTNSLTSYAYPVIGDLSVEEIATSHIVQILADPSKPSGEQLWSAKTETAQRLRGRIEAVLDWAIAGGFRTVSNPARWQSHLELMLPSPKQLRRIKPVKHHKSVPWQDAPAFLTDLRRVHGNGARCLEFVMLTVARSGEARLARWPEFNLDDAIWTVPPDRMKAGREHRVPLCRQAVALLQKLPRDVTSDLVFLSTKRGAPLSDMTLSATMRRMGLTAVPHGLRSTFRVWAAESTDYPREIAEAALAHQIGDSNVERAYLRTDHLGKRAQMMQDYADFLEAMSADGDVNNIGEQPEKVA